MDAQNLELVKSLSYAFYGICAIVVALIGLMAKFYFGVRAKQKEELKAKEDEMNAKILAVKEIEKEKSDQALKCQTCQNQIADLQTRHKETDDWIREIVGEMKEGFAAIRSTIKEALARK